MGRFFVLLALGTAIQGIAATPHAKPFEKLRRQASVPADSLQVDLGYEIYEGIVNSSTRLNTYKG